MLPSLLLFLVTCLWSLPCPCPCLLTRACTLQERIAEVQRALRKAGLPLGGKASKPETVEDFPFHHDPKVE